MSVARFVALSVVLGVSSPVAARAPTCGELGAAAVIDDGPVLRWARAVWDEVDGARRRIDVGAPPRVGWVELGAINGAWYCRQADTIFASRALVEYAWLGRATDGGDMLAFVLAHELAHRRFDPRSPSEPFLGRDTCNAGDLGLERGADERAGFLVALARRPGEPSARMSPWRLERDTTLDYYLAEVGATPCAEARRAALRRSLERMEGYGDAYEIALALAFAPTDAAIRGPSARSLADRLLDALDGALNPVGSWARVPELTTLVAWIAAQRAARLAGGMCDTAFPRFAAATPFDPLGARVDGDPLALVVARARAALERARSNGAEAASLAPIERCLELAIGGRPAVRPRALAAPAQAVPGFDGLLERLALAAASPCGAGSTRVTPIEGVGRLLVVEDPAASCYELTATAPTAALRVVVTRPIDGLAASLDAWLAHCEVFGGGRGDDGTDAFGARCPSVDTAVEDGWSLFARGTTVERVVRVTHLAPVSPGTPDPP